MCRSPFMFDQELVTLIPTQNIKPQLKRMDIKNKKDISWTHQKFIKISSENFFSPLPLLREKTNDKPFGRISYSGRITKKGVVVVNLLT